MKNDEYEKTLIGERDFLKLIINDLCYYFNVESWTKYEEMAKSLIEAINRKKK